MSTAIAALIVAVWVATYARRQAQAAIDQAAGAQRSADAANDQAASAREQAEIASRQLALSEQVHREQQEPYVMVDIQLNRHVKQVFDLVIENVGPSVARNVKIAFDPPLERVRDLDEVQADPIADIYIFTDGIPQIPPRHRLEFFLDVTHERLNSSLPKVYTVTVDAEGPFGRVETLTHKIDLNIYMGGIGRLGVKSVHQGVQELEKIRGEIRATGRSIASAISGVTEMLHTSENDI
ncbi:hypothetical protein [Sinosporangium siamense]|uniref:hypothetical protein n=1 Tax=Sinosporangium siamense TaxID=1367973 RepID=UPI0036D2866B